MKNRIIKYEELINIITKENKEELVNIKDICHDIILEYPKKDMNIFTKNKIFIRKTVAQKLKDINQELKNINKNYQLKIIYGYRHPLVQEKYFETQIRRLKKRNPNLSKKKLLNLAHNFIAVPNVAGHPTGGAVDLTIQNKKEDLDMGTKIGDFSKQEKIKTFSKKINSKQLKNRLLLHDLMLKYNFAPFYGEWWHFSYGDKEWSLFYNKKNAIYDPINFSIS